MMKKKNITSAAATEREYIEAWQEHKRNFLASTPVDPNERPAARLKRIAELEKDATSWFRYYFPMYCSAPFAQFHLAAIDRELSNPEWYEWRAWSRELAKTALEMMITIFQSVTKRKRNIMIVSASKDAAERLLLPYKVCFESNQRLINDYGPQEQYGSWSKDCFITRGGAGFLAIGWEGSARGSRMENVRPDKLIFDDIDTDEECRNEEIQKLKVAKIEQAFIGTRSISTPTQIIGLGNIIHQNCTANLLRHRVDHFDQINIIDQDGLSSWPEKNTAAHIERLKNTISYESFQKEYCNNPLDGGDTFKDIQCKDVPKLHKCDDVLIYADPATSNKDTTQASHKVVAIIARKKLNYYIIKCFCDTMSNAKFIEALFECYACCTGKLDSIRVWMENNSLQDPFYTQVLLPLIYQQGNQRNQFLPITPDTRNKGDKYTRIEATLEPLNRLGHLYINAAEQDNPHMQRLVAQFKGFNRKQKRMDGPDCIEGGVWILQRNASLAAEGQISLIPRNNLNRF